MPTRGENSPGNQQESDTGNPVTEQVQQKAGQVAQQARQQTTSLAQTQKSKASQSLNQVSHALQQTGQQLQEQGQNMPGQALTTAAQQVDRVAGYLESHQVQDIVVDVENFGRRRPAVFLSGAFGIGFMLSRFLKSSPPNDTTGRGGDGSQ